MRKVIVSLAPVRAGDAVDANALAEDVKKKCGCRGGDVSPALSEARWKSDGRYFLYGGMF